MFTKVKMMVKREVECKLFVGPGGSALPAVGKSISLVFAYGIARAA